MWIEGVSDGEIVDKKNMRFLEELHECKYLRNSMNTWCNDGQHSLFKVLFRSIQNIPQEPRNTTYSLFKKYNVIFQRNFTRKKGPMILRAQKRFFSEIIRRWRNCVF